MLQGLNFLWNTDLLIKTQYNSYYGSYHKSKVELNSTSWTWEKTWNLVVNSNCDQIQLSKNPFSLRIKFVDGLVGYHNFGGFKIK